MKPNASAWLLKTEPSTYGIEDLKKDQKTNWNGIRNFQAQKNLKQMKAGDLALIYHTGDEKSVVGLGRVTKEAYPEEENWVQVGLSFERAFKRPVSIVEMKANKVTQILFKQSRLSVIPVPEEALKEILRLEKT